MGISKLPFAGFFVGTLILTLSACGGQPIVFNGNPLPSSEASSNSETSSSSISSTSSISSVSSISSTSSVSPTSSVSSSSSSSADPTGRDLYTSTRLGCSTCHGATGQGGTTPEDIDPSEWDTASLELRIRTTMPQQTASYVGVSCNQACATKIAAYILSGFSTSNEQPNQLLKQAKPAYSLLNNGEINCGIAYSSNNVRPLTRQEYSSTIFQLTGIDVISKLGQSVYDALPPDTTAALTVDGSSQQSYDLAAGKIVENLSANNFAGVIDCANLNSAQCYSQLVDDFACKAFRRPLTAAERSDYLATYSASSDNKEGVKKVTNAILTSANFLYRSNIGVSLLNRETDNNTTLALAGTVSLLKENKTLTLNKNTRISANFSGNDLLEISLKSTQNANGLWPVMRVQVGNSTFVDLRANQTDATYKFHITGLVGPADITIANQPMDAPLEYQTGHNLVISSIKVALSY